MKRVPFPLLVGAVVAALATAACGQKPGATTAVTLTQAEAPEPAATQPAAQPSPEPSTQPSPEAAAQPSPVATATAMTQARVAAEPSPAPEPVTGGASSSGGESQPAGSSAQRAQQSGDAANEQDYGRLFWGRGFSSISVREGGRERELVDGAAIQVAFEHRKPVSAVRWRASCNWMGGPVRVTAERLLIDYEGGTDMGCADADHEQDDWLGAFFEADPRWTFDGDRLRLTAGDVVIDFEETGYW